MTIESWNGVTEATNVFAESLTAVTLDGLPTQVVVLDPSGTIQYVNEAWQRFSSSNDGQSNSSGVGQNYLAVCDAATGLFSHEAVAAANGIRAVLRGDQAEFSLDYPCHAPDQHRWFRLRVAPIELGDTIGAVVMHADITGTALEAAALRQAEHLARESEERLNFALEAARIGDWHLDLRTNVVHRSLRYDQCFGYDAMLPEWSCDTFLAHIDRADRDRVDAGLKRALVGNGDFSEEFQATWADGSRHWLWARGKVYVDEGGEPLRLAGIILDITARKQAEIEAARLASIVASSDDAILGINLDGTIASWNRGAQKIFGHTADEVVGASIMQIIPLDRQAEELAYMERVARGDSVEHLETIRTTKEGRAIQVSLTLSPIRDASGAVIGTSKVARDISEQKRLEQQFLRAQRLESIGTLAGGIAHDLNNVLTPIMLSLELLKMSSPDQESQELISVIDGSARRGSEMVQQVLSFARGVKGQRFEIDVEHLILVVQKITKDTFRKHIAIRTDVPANLWRVIGDSTQLHQVLLNLCLNARDAMPNGGQLIMAAENITLDAHDADVNIDAKAGMYVVLRVEDSGTGILPDVLDRIFDPFFTTKEVGQGTGLGLSTSMGIVKSHGGFIRVYSEPGRGSKFNVYIPARAGTSVDVGAPASAPELPRGHGELVLVVDDEPAVREITQLTLEAFGYRVLVAVDGSDAVAIYARRGDEIAVVLTDMMMPVMDGPATIRVLRKMNPLVRIIAASGRDANAHGVGLGITHFLPKPYAADRLLTTLRDALAVGA
jgi:PAS domain S-box-containing protein